MVKSNHEPLSRLIAKVAAPADVIKSGPPPRIVSVTNIVAVGAVAVINETSVMNTLDEPTAPPHVRVIGVVLMGPPEQVTSPGEIPGSASNAVCKPAAD